MYVRTHMYVYVFLARVQPAACVSRARAHTRRTKLVYGSARIRSAYTPAASSLDVCLYVLAHTYMLQNYSLLHFALAVCIGAVHTPVLTNAAGEFIDMVRRSGKRSDWKLFRANDSP